MISDKSVLWWILRSRMLRFMLVFIWSIFFLAFFTCFLCTFFLASLCANFISLLRFERFLFNFPPNKILLLVSQVVQVEWIIHVTIEATAVKVWVEQVSVSVNQATRVDLVSSVNTMDILDNSVLWKVQIYWTIFQLGFCFMKWRHLII